jgi:glycosyltransferase involved in cell wall biosynthesis
LKYFLWQKKLNSVLKNNRFDAVIFLGDWKFISTWFAVRSLQKNGVHCLFWSHGLLNKHKSLNNSLKYWFLERFRDGGFLYSHAAKQNLLSMGYPYNLTVIYNSLDFKLQVETINKISSEAKPGNPAHPYLVFTGRLLADRHLELVFDAMKLLNEENIRVDLVIIGSGPHLDNLKNYAGTLGLEDRVKFLGAIYDENVIGRYFMNAAACVFPGPIGLTVIHSFTYGTPVITNDNFARHKPEAEVLVDEVNSFLFKEGDRTALAQKIKRVLNLNALEKEQFKINTFKAVQEKYNPEKQTELIVNRLSQLRKIKSA